MKQSRPFLTSSSFELEVPEVKSVPVTHVANNASKTNTCNACNGVGASKTHVHAKANSSAEPSSAKKVEKAVEIGSDLAEAVENPYCGEDSAQHWNPFCPSNRSHRHGVPYIGYMSKTTQQKKKGSNWPCSQPKP